MPAAQESETPTPPTQTQSQYVAVGADGRIPGTDEWEADRILDETATKFLIAWVGVNPQTGREWLPSWEPKKGGTGKDLILQWEDEKRRNPDVAGNGAQILREAKQAERHARVEAKNAAASASGGRRARAGRMERDSTVSTDVPPATNKSRAATKEKRKRDSTISSDLHPPPGKKRAGAGTRAGARENPIAVDSPEDGARVERERTEDSSALTSDMTTPDQPPKRAAAPSAKVRDNAEQVATAASGSKTGSSSRAASSPAKSNRSLSKVAPVASSSKITKPPTAKSSSVKLTLKAAPGPGAPPSSSSTGTPVTSSPRAASRLANNGASPISKKTTAAKPLPLEPLAVSPKKSKARPPAEANGKEAIIVEKDRGKTPPREAEDAQDHNLSSPNPPTLPAASPRNALAKSPSASRLPSTANKSTPIAKSASSTQSTNTTKPPPATRKPVGPVAQLPIDVFHTALKEKLGKEGSSAGPADNDRPIIDKNVANGAPKHPHGTQSTTTTHPSQAESIVQFSSPTRSPAQSASRRLPVPTPHSPPPPAPSALEPSAEISPRRSKAVTEKRIIDGTEITVLVRDESESSFDEESDATMSDGRPDEQPAISNGEEYDSGTDYRDTPATQGDVLGLSASAADMDAVEVTVEEHMTLDIVPDTSERSAEKNTLHGVNLRVVKVEKADPANDSAVSESENAGENAPVAAPAVERVRTETDISPAQNDAKPAQSPEIVIVEQFTTKTIVEEIIPAASAALDRTKSSHLFSRNSRAGSRTSEIRSRNPSPSNDSESPTKATSPSLHPDEIVLKNEEIITLRSRLEAERERNQVIRMQLDKAHNVIVDLRQTEKDNAAQISVLQEQLAHGLAQQRLLVSSVHKRRDAENAELRAQNRFLLEQARLTDDAIRKRAARYPALRKEHDQCAGRYQASEDRVAALVHRNNELSEQIALLRAQHMGVMEGEDASDDEPSDLSSPYSSDYDQKRPRAERKPAHQKTEKEVLSPEDKVKRCAFAGVGGGCDLVFTDDEAHLQHILEHKARLAIDPFPVTIDLPIQ